MTIPKSIYDLAPSIKDDLIKIEATLIVLKRYRLTKLYPNQIGKPLMTRVVFRYLVYQQVVAHRIYDLVMTIISAWEHKQISSAFILLRAVNENASVIYDANKRLEPLLEKGDFQGIYKLIFNLQYGTKINELIEDSVKHEINFDAATIDIENEKLEVREAYTAQQIMNVIDRISKHIPTHRKLYEYLCEYSHPNWSGLMGLYCNWEDKFTVNISNEISFNEQTAKKYFTALNLFLEMFCIGYDGIIKKHPEISKLAIDDMKKAGRDTKSYETI